MTPVCAACNEPLLSDHACRYSTHSLAGAPAPARPPAPPFPLTASDAFEQSAWYLRYALDRIDTDPKCQHPAVTAHAIAARTQHTAISTAITHLGG